MNFEFCCCILTKASQPALLASDLHSTWFCFILASFGRNYKTKKKTGRQTCLHLVCPLPVGNLSAQCVCNICLLLPVTKDVIIVCFFLISGFPGFGGLDLGSLLTNPAVMSMVRGGIRALKILSVDNQSSFLSLTGNPSPSWLGGRSLGTRLS